MLSVAVRTARQAAIRGRSLHTTSPTHDAHGHYHHLPFDFPTKANKGVFGAKLAVYLMTGFSIPFIASWWQLKKSGGV